MRNVAVKLPAELLARIDALGKRRGATRSALVRAALTRFLDEQRSTGSALERVLDLVGVGRSGVPDLGSNPKHLEAFGDEKRHPARRRPPGRARRSK